MQVNLQDGIKYILNDKSNLRNWELETYYLPESPGVFIQISFRQVMMIQAGLNLIRVTLILLIFFASLFSFKKEARQKILKPLEVLLNKVRMMSLKPSSALKPSFQT